MTPSTDPKVAIILLNYRGAQDTVTCLQSLQRLTYPNIRVIVVDNHSMDGSVEHIRSAHPGGELIVSDANLGYSGGNNLGIRRVLEDPDIAYIWLLNNDTTVEPEALSAMVTQSQRFPKALIGSLILYPDGRFQRVGNRLNRWRGTLRSYPQSEVTDGQAVESLTGCSMLIPREVFEQIGLLDERYFLYFEDNDFCLRAQEAGYRCIVASGSRVFHKEGAATGRNRPLVTYYYQRNRLLLLQKVASPIHWRTIRLYTRYRLFRSRIKSERQKNNDAFMHHQAFLLAVTDFYRGVSGECPHALLKDSYLPEEKAPALDR